MDYKNLLTIEKDEILIVKINRPKVRNCVNTETGYELFDVFNKFDENPNQKVAILLGKEGSFCAGADLKENANPDIEKMNKRLEHPYMGPLGPTRRVLKKPVIAAVEGYAVAGGLELAIWCDLIVSHPEATFGVFCRRFSVPLMDGGTVKLARIIGLNRAMDMILTGRSVTGKEAYDWGMVNRLVSKKNVFDEAMKLAKFLCELPQECMRNDRLSLIENLFGDINSQYQREKRFGTEIILKGLTKEDSQRFVDSEGRHGKIVLKRKPKL